MHYQEIITKESDFLAMTSLTPDEFFELIPAFEQAFQERMKEYCLDGHLRTGREYVSYANSPLPTPEDRLFFILVYIKTHPIQVVHGQMFGLPQNKANQWIHTLLPVLQMALHLQGDAPMRTWTDLKLFFESHEEPSPFLPRRNRAASSSSQKCRCAERPLQWQEKAPFPKKPLARRQYASHSLSQSHVCWQNS